MFSNYKYQILLGESNRIDTPNYRIYSNSIDDAYDYIESQYKYIIKKEKWVIDRVYNFNSFDSIMVLNSEYYNIECEIRQINPVEIFKTIEYYKDIGVGIGKKKNPNLITIRSLYIESIQETNLIKLFELKSNFSIYQNKYLNLLGYIQVENSPGEITEEPDPDYLSHIEVDKKIIWFLQNHFRKKTLDNGIIQNNLASKTNFILDSDNFAFDDDTNIILAIYNVVLN